MTTDPSHLSLSMTGTLASGAGSQQQAPLPQPQSHQQSSSSNQTSDSQETSPASTRRGPGRPKGSTKKSLEVDSSPPKIKRPVGRPRKDGRPAGSVPKVPRGPGRPRKNFPPDFAVNTFPQQNHSQQPNGDPQEWPPGNTLPGQSASVHGATDSRQLQQGIFNYRLPKEAAPEPTAPIVADGPPADKSSGPSATADTNANGLSQNPKWFPSSSANTTSNAPAASSSSIANALVHPHNMGLNGSNHFSDSLVAPSVLGLADRRERVNNTNDISAGTRGFGEGSLSIPPAQIPNFILSTISSLFSRPSTNGFPLPREVLTMYRSHLGHLSGSHSMAYTILKTFWLPYSPLLFRQILPRTAPSSKSAHRNPSISQKPSSSSLNSSFAPQSSHPTVNGDPHIVSRTVTTGEQSYESHRFFYWDPFYLSLSGPLSCPVCQQAPLAHLGPVRTGPLRVFDLPSSCAPSAISHANAGLVPAAFYVIGMQYVCSQRTCGIQFYSWDHRIVEKLPRVLADEWPVHLSSVTESEQSDSRGARWSGDAVSRPLYTLTKTLLQAGSSQAGVRDVLAKLWNWNDSEREEEHEDNESTGEVVDITATNNDQDKAAAVEALFASPYEKLWTAQTVHNHDGEPSVGAPMANGQRPAKRQKTNDVPPSLPPMVSATAPAYLSRTFVPQNSTAGDNGSSSIGLQVHDHRTNGSGLDNRSPRLLPQPQPQPNAHLRHQPSQSQLKPNTSARPQPSSRPPITHSRAPHIHTPSPIYPSTSLPNSTANSPQTGGGAQLSLKRPLEPETHHPSNAGGPSIPPAPAPVSTQTSQAQPHFPGINHNSPYTHLRPLQQQHPSHPSHPSHPPPNLPSHHQASAPTRHAPPPLPMHHSSLGLGPNPLSRYNQTTLQPHQSLLATAPHPPPLQPLPSQSHAPQAPVVQQHAPQRRVRHCVKCGRHDCKGKGGSQFCKNNCKDCGGMDCRGRNSKRPNATCREGW